MFDRRSVFGFVVFFASLPITGSSIALGQEATSETGPVMLIGGRHQDLSDSLRKEFIRLAGGESAKIVVIPTGIADADDPEAVEEIIRPWRDLRPQSVGALHTRDPRTANAPEFVRPLVDATGVFFTNGHAHRFTDAYLGTRFQEELKRVHARGGVIGGTSTGAAVLGEQMVRRGEVEQATVPGLGIVQDLLIDDTNRPAEFERALSAFPEHLGLLLEPGAAVTLRGGSFEVHGEGSVLFRRLKSRGK
jgi:cyanophycinase